MTDHFMKQWLKRNFQPDYITDGVHDIDYKDLFDSGIRLLLLDIDNTLAVHGSHESDNYAKTAIENMKLAGFSVYILSNARKHRAQSFASGLGVEAEGMAYKPSPKILLKTCERLQYKQNETCMIGDQLLTDIWAARRAGVQSILVKPRSVEESGHIRIKRLIERIILKIIDK
jgi:HAD superfamily phosphatase (TIGR01668 family)